MPPPGGSQTALDDARPHERRPEPTAPARPGADPASGNAERFGYRPAIDGLRALAVVAVMLYHADVVFAPGGFLGVDLFFVLSGYLITTLLILEWRASTTVDFRQFWARRARRLLPALFMVLAVVSVYQATLASYTQNSKFRGDAFATLAYVANWWFAFSDQSYFDDFDAPSMLRHAWSLGIEEQFYILWPLVMLVGMKVLRLKPMGWLVGLLGAAWISAGLMLVLYQPGEDTSRVYYGTDTRAQALLIGAALAFVLQHLDLERVRRRSVEVMGVVALAVFVALCVFVHDTDGWMYQGGYLLAAVAAAGAIAATSTARPNHIGQLFANGPAVWIGQRSYGLYLWHWPIFILISTHTDLTGPAGVVVKFGLTAAVAMLSYQLLEMPIRQRRLTGRQEGTVLATSLVALVALIVLVTTVFQPEPEGLEAIVEDNDLAGDVGEAACGDEGTGVTPPGALRTLMVGDSVALSLAYYWRQAGMTDIDVRSCTMLGCGVARAPIRYTNGRDSGNTERCETWPANWAAAVEAYHPDVSVIMTGAWDIFDREIDGELLAVGTPEHDAYLTSELADAADVLTSQGGTVVLLTSQCFDIPTKGIPWEERGDESRVDAINEVFRSFAASRDDVEVVDLHGYLCPTGLYQATLDGVTLHEDGAHFVPEGASLVWRWLEPQLEEIAAR